MPKSYRPYEPDQLLLMPPSLADWVPEDHLARFVGDVVASLDLRAIGAGAGDLVPILKALREREDERQPCRGGARCAARGARRCRLRRAPRPADARGDAGRLALSSGSPDDGGAGSAARAARGPARVHARRRRRALHLRGARGGRTTHQRRSRSRAAYKSDGGPNGNHQNGGSPSLFAMPFAVLALAA